MRKIGTLNFDDLLSDVPEIKYGCAKEAVNIAKETPEDIYPYLEKFINLLDSRNNILKWTAIDIIGLVSKVDKEKKVDQLLNRLFELLDSGKMITANHAVESLANIAASKPEYKAKITEELLKVESYIYDTDECRNIALGKVILAFGAYLDKINRNTEVMHFIERQTQNTHNSTKKKAEHLLKKING